jgi:hypothetical protein
MFYTTILGVYRLYDYFLFGPAGFVHDNDVDAASGIVLHLFYTTSLRPGADDRVEYK